MAERDLIVLSEEPLNAETRLDERTPEITPAGRHYVRTHFPMPEGPREIAIEGARTTSISADDVRRLPSRKLVVTMECAGNGRRFLEPKAPGEQWGLGAVGTAEWTGVPLRTVLERAAIPSGATEVLLRGADEGVPKDLGKRIAYERSLPLEMALGDDVLVAHEMNGEPIPKAHGGPLRLVVPGWYGMASVKWLARITVLDRPFNGFFQTDRYVIEGRPVRQIAPRAVITSPVDGAEMPAGSIEVRGYAWSGAAPIARVELYAGSGAEGTARDAELEPARSPYAWRAFHERFSFELALGGVMEVDIVARATDTADNVQPLRERTNELGYMNNAARPVRIRVRS